MAQDEPSESGSKKLSDEAERYQQAVIRSYLKLAKGQDRIYKLHRMRKRQLWRLAAIACTVGAMLALVLALVG